MHPSPWSQELYINAYRFAAQAHGWQRMPGTPLPYIMHLSFVAMEILAAVAQGASEPLLHTPAPRGAGAPTGTRDGVEPSFSADLAVQCALLHDTLEDTRVRYDEVREQFGEAVAEGVLALTLNRKLPKAEQMTECLGRIRQQAGEIWMVKLADRITNLQPPPPHWSKRRIQDYHRESQVIHEALKDASAFLAQRLRLKIGQYAAFGTLDGLQR